MIEPFTEIGKRIKNLILDMYIEMPVRYSSLFPSLFYFDSIFILLLLSHLSERIKETVL